MDRAGSSLKRGVGCHVEIIFCRVSDILLNNRTGLNIAISVRRTTVIGVGEETVMMTLGANCNSNSRLALVSYIKAGL